jgi:hypothetical protein
MGIGLRDFGGVMLGSQLIGKRPSTVRSALTNDPLKLRGIDGRSVDSRRYRDLVLAFIDDLGGEACASEADKALARQAAGAVVASEGMQARIISGEVVDLEQATRQQNAANRFLQALRDRQKPKAGPTLAEFLALSRVPVASP